MTFRKEAADLLAHLSETLQCAPLELDANDTAMMGLDDDLGVVFYAEPGATDNEGALIISVIAGKPDPDDAELLYDLMCANYMWNASGSGTIGIDAQTGALSIHRLVELPMPPAVFEDVVANLAGAARYWRGRLHPASSGVPRNADAMLRV